MTRLKQKPGRSFPIDDIKATLPEVFDET